MQIYIIRLFRDRYLFEHIREICLYLVTNKSLSVWTKGQRQADIWDKAYLNGFINAADPSSKQGWSFKLI